MRTWGSLLMVLGAGVLIATVLSGPPLHINGVRVVDTIPVPGLLAIGAGLLIGGAWIRRRAVRRAVSDAHATVSDEGARVE